MKVSFEIILAPILTLFVVQSIKLATDGIKGNFNLKSLLTSYGGMPSSHTAFVTSLTVMIGYLEGVNSVAFAIAFIFSLIVITDAMVLRRRIDQQDKAIKRLIEILPADEKNKFSYVASSIKHTFPQVLVGAIIGFVIAFLVQLLY